MSGTRALRLEVATLRHQNQLLRQRAADAHLAESATGSGEREAVAATPAVSMPSVATAAADAHGEWWLRTVFENASGALVVADAAGACVDATPAACEVFGQPRDRLIGRVLAGLAAADPGGVDGAPAGAGAVRDRATGHGKVSLLRPDGSHRVVEWSAVASVGPGLGLWLVRDVTEQSAGEESLRRSEALFRAMFEKSAEAISLTAVDGTALYMSPAATRLLGWTADDRVGHNSFDRVVAADRERAVSEMARLVSGEVSEISLELGVIHQDGSLRWIEATGTSLLDDPEVRAIVANFHDVTARRQSEDALRDSERRYRRLIEELPEPVLVHVDRKIAYANLASARVAGLASGDLLIGRSIAEFATPDTAGQIAARTDALEHGESLGLAEQVFVRPGDGAEVHVEVKTIPIVFEGKPATLSIARDITTRVLSERAAVAALQVADLGRRKLEAVLAALPVGVWLAEPDGRLTESNPAAVRIRGGPLPDAASPADYARYRAYWPATGKVIEAEDWALVRTIRAGATIVAEAVDIERFDGSRRHVLNSTAPILDEQGQLVGAVVVMLDVTEVHEAMRERERLITTLEFERRRLGTLLEKAPACIAMVRGPDHVFEFVNTAYQVATGSRDLIGKPLLVAMPEVAGQGLVELLDDVLRTGVSFVAEGLPVTLVRRFGSRPEPCFFNFVYQPIVEADGSRSGVFVHAIDVTDVTIAQRRVRAQFHGVPVPTYVWQRVERDGQPQFVLIDFNQAALAISGERIAAHLGDTATAFFRGAPAIAAELDRCLDEGVAIQREMDHTLISGRQRRLFVTYASVPPDLVIVHTEDVTERAKLEQQLQQAQKMEAVGRLAGGVAHDFNNLLSVILSYSELAIESLTPGDPLRDDLVEIRGAGRRATDLTRQLLAFSRQQLLQPRVIDLVKVVSGMWSMLCRLLGEDIEVAILPGDDVGRVLADPGQIEQVVMNLAVNARDAMADGGRLTIELANAELDAGHVATRVGVAAGSYVMLALTDTGVGMDAATRDKIFEPFFTTKDMGKGTGLGLSMVFGIVDQSGGHVEVDSEPGRGSRFRIYLPRTDCAVDVVAAVPAASPLRGSETILLVEDEPQVRAVACAILRRSGYHVLETSSGGDAFLASEDYGATIDLLVTDVVMPRMSGRKLAERLAIQRPAMKVLYASGYNDDAIIRHGVLEAGVAFLQKPFTPDQLLRHVRQVLDAP